MKRRNTSVSAQEYIDAILANPVTYELGELIPEKTSERGGRPRHYPGWAYLLYDQLISVFRSARRVDAVLAYPGAWANIRRTAVERFPFEPEKWLRPQPMNRGHWAYAKKTFLADQAVWTELKALFTRRACEQAESLGLCQPGAGSLTHPDLSRMLYADGKVVAPLYRAKPGEKRVDRATGEVREAKADGDASLFVTGSGTNAWGNCFVQIACRTPQPHGRIIVNFAWVPSNGEEARTAVAALGEVAAHLPGAQGVIYDGALHGKHLQEILHTQGLLPVSPVSAKAGGRRVGKPRVERTAAVERLRLPGGETIELYARAGQLGYQEPNERGDDVFLPLRRVKVDRRQNKRDGTYRWYGTYELPADLGGGTIMLRLDTTDDDRRRGFNRTEHLRAIPPADADFRRLYPRRSDAESINRGLEDTLWLGRAHSVGARSQLIDFLGFALMVNSLALFRHARAADPPSAAAA